MPILTVSDIENVAGDEFDDNIIGLVESFIPQVQGEIENYLGRPVEPREFTEHHVRNWSDTVILVNYPPCQSVASVAIQSYVLPPTLYGVFPWGVSLYGYGFGLTDPRASPAVWVSPVLDYDIVYSGGLDGSKIPAIQAVMSRAVLRQVAFAKEGWSARAGYTSMKVDDFSWKKNDNVILGTAGGKGGATTYGSIVATDLAVLDRYKLRTVA